MYNKTHPRGVAALMAIVIAFCFAAAAAGSVYVIQNKKINSQDNRISELETLVNDTKRVSELNFSDEMAVNPTSSDTSEATAPTTNTSTTTNTAATNTSTTNTSTDSSTAVSIAATSDELTVGNSKTYDNIGMTFTLNSVDTSSNKAVLGINYYDKKNSKWTVNDPGDNGYIPNPVFYPSTESGVDLLSQAQTLYRLHYTCDGKIDPSAQPVGAYEEIPLASGYTNFVCRNREYEQCERDGSADRYYSEKCDFGNVTFSTGDIKCSTDFGVRLDSVSEGTAEITVVERATGSACDKKLFSTLSVS
ncbi:MAG: hypothetical protein WC495_02060 [Patescibacteria group bacterium]|jgi:hypothetical protein